MKTFNILIFFFLLSFPLSAQNYTYSFDLFNVKLQNSVLKVWDKQNNLIYTGTFSNPTADTIDYDDDGVNEFYILESRFKAGKTYYMLYIYNTIDSFYLADSIDSGLLKPLSIFSDEINGIMIVSGNPKFNFLNTDSLDVYLPLNCWRYESGKIFNINTKIYDYFISENDTLIENIDSYLENNRKDCNTTDSLKALLASVYANYLNAGEKILAKQFLQKYYLCKDIESFKQKIISLL